MRPMPRRKVARQQGLIRRPVRTRMDASAELVRLEYERDKLTRQLAELKERFTQTEGDLAKVAARAAWLHDFLDADMADAAPGAPETIAVTVNIPVPAAVRGRVKLKARA
jgi:hypothetical protein